MSFFHNRSVFGDPDNDPDIVHLGSLGCDVLFSHYDAGARSGPCQNRYRTRNLVIKGHLVLLLEGKRLVIRAGEWFDIPPRTEYQVECLSACATIEFCFDVHAPA